MNRIVRLSLRCVVPDDVEPDQVAAYVEDAVRTMGGGGHPDDWSFNAFHEEKNLEVKVTYPKQK